MTSQQNRQHVLSKSLQYNICNYVIVKVPNSKASCSITKDMRLLCIKVKNLVFIISKEESIKQSNSIALGSDEKHDKKLEERGISKYQKKKVLDPAVLKFTTSIHIEESTVFRTSSEPIDEIKEFLFQSELFYTKIS